MPREEVSPRFYEAQAEAYQDLIDVSLPQITVGATGADYTTIAAALAAVPVGGAEVLVYRGTYAGGFTISTAKTTLRGEGRNSVIIQSPISSANCIDVTAADVTIEGIQIDGQRASQSTTLNPTACGGIYVTAARCTIRKSYIHSIRNMGIHGNTDADDLVVEDNRIENHATNGSTWGGAFSYKGVYVASANRPVIRRNTIKGWSQAVGLWFGVNDGLVEKNFILDNYGYEDNAGTVHRSACEDYGANNAHGTNLWIGNVIDGSTSHCLEIAQGVVGSQFLNNILRNPGKLSNAGSHFEVTGASGQLTTDILLQGNYCITDGSRAISNTVNGLSYRVTISKNFFVGFNHASTSAPVFIGGTAGPEDVTVEDNKFYTCVGGITFNNNGDGMVVRGNVLREIGGSVGGIILTAGSGHIVEGNKVLMATGATGHGIAVTTGNQHLVTGNRVVAQGGAGINVATADNRVADNYVSNANAANLGAINVTGAAALRNIVRDNYCTSTTTRRPLAVVSSADYNIVQGNTLTGNVLTGVYTSSAGTHNTIEPNHDASVTRALTLKALGAQTVGTSEATVAHGLGYTPTEVVIVMTSAGTIWKSTASTSTNILLTADAVDRTAEVYVR